MPTTCFAKKENKSEEKKETWHARFMLCLRVFVGLHQSCRSREQAPLRSNQASSFGLYRVLDAFRVICCYMLSHCISLVKHGDVIWGKDHVDASAGVPAEETSPIMNGVELSHAHSTCLQQQQASPKPIFFKHLEARTCNVPFKLLTMQ